jgi:hypothetical protein
MLQNEASKNISTRVALSTYDQASAEQIKKISEQQAANLNNDSVTPQALISAEYHSAILEDRNTKAVKPATKIVLFDFSFELFKDKKRLYNNIKKLDFKDEVVNKFIYHSNYPIADFCFLSRSYVIAFVGRFICKFSLPEIDLTKKVNF